MMAFNREAGQVSMLTVRSVPGSQISQLWIVGCVEDRRVAAQLTSSD
jgi:hypothetical protein